MSDDPWKVEHFGVMPESMFAGLSLDLVIRTQRLHIFNLQLWLCLHCTAMQTPSVCEQQSTPKVVLLVIPMVAGGAN